MAGLREIAKEYKDEIMDGIAWVAIWKTGRSWHAQAFWLNQDTDRIEDEDMEEARAIVAADDKAIFINEYYTAHMGDGKLDEIVEGIRSQYESGGYLLTDHTTYVTEEETEEPENLKNTEKKPLIECRKENLVLHAVLLVRQINKEMTKEKDIEFFNLLSKEELVDYIEHFDEVIEEAAAAEEPEEPYEDYEPRYTSCTAGDYSPSCPWNAPGMSISDFI